MSLLGLLIVPQRGVTTFCPFFIRFGLLRKATEHLGWLAWSQESIGRKRTATEARKSGGLRCISSVDSYKTPAFYGCSLRTKSCLALICTYFKSTTPRATS